MSHCQDSATHNTIQLSTDSYCPTLTKETLVSQPPKINNRLSEKAFSQRSSTSAKIKHSSSKSSSIQSNCMALIDKHFKEKGFSKQTRKLLQASWRKGTQKDYSCKFRKFNSWCSRREVDPYNASLTDAAEFPTELFSKLAPFEPMKHAHLKYVTWKTAFLIAITSFRRCSDPQTLCIGEESVVV